MSTSSGVSIFGSTSTSTKLVWRKLSALNGLSRTKRCTPFSERNLPYANGPDISSTTVFNPPSSLADRSKTSVFMPDRSAHRKYIRSSICAKSWASNPPTPAEIRTTASRPSYFPLNSRSVLRAENSVSRASICLVNSSNKSSSPSSISSNKSSS